MTVLVTGGAGYVGSVCVERLLSAGHEVVVVDDLSTGRRESVEDGAVFFNNNCNDGEVLRSIFHSYDIDVIMHFAADSDASCVEPRKLFWNNVANGVSLLDEMVDCGCKKLIFSSSAAIFGNTQYAPVDELHPTFPTNTYGDAKLFFEKILDRYGESYGIESASLRYFNAAGATKKHGNVKPVCSFIPVVVDAALNNNTVRVFGGDYDTRDGTCIRDYVHVSDLADAHMLVMDKTGKYNLGNGIGFSNLEVIASVERVSGKKVKYEIVPRRKGDIVESVASCDLAKKELGWNPSHADIDDMVASEIDWQCFLSKENAGSLVYV